MIQGENSEQAWKVLQHYSTFVLSMAVLQDYWDGQVLQGKNICQAFCSYGWIRKTVLGNDSTFNVCLNYKAETPSSLVGWYSDTEFPGVQK